MINNETFLSLFNSILSLLIMIIPGFILKKVKIGDEHLSLGLTNVILYVSSPAMLINGFLREFDKGILTEIVQVFIFSLVAHLITTAVAYLGIRKFPDKVKRVMRYSVVFSNAGYMGIPIIMMTFGDKAAIYASVYLIWFQVFQWTLGCLIYTDDKKYMTLKKAIINPSVISVIVGLILFFTSAVNFIPESVSEVASGLAGTVAPLSMLLVGLRLADVDFKSAFKTAKLYYAMYLRLIVCPVLVWIFMAALKFFGLNISDIAMSVTLVCASTPVAVATTMFAEKFDCDPPFASQLVSTSTIISLATIPLVSSLLLIDIPSVFTLF